MRKIAFISFFIVVVLFQCTSLRIHSQKQHQNSKSKIISSKRQHKYYNLQETNRVSSSRSVQYLNQCKDLCLQMHQFFPFQFKYHRLIYRQSEGNMKYITGQCFYAFKNKSSQNQTDKNKQTPNQNKTDQRKWYDWNKLKSFVDMSVVEDPISLEQKKAWVSYSKDCQDESLKLSESSRIEFKFTVVHSDFQYYENQGFKNLQPFDDFDQLLSGLSPMSV